MLPGVILLTVDWSGRPFLTTSPGLQTTKASSRPLPIKALYYSGVSLVVLTGSRVTDILLNGWILPIGGASAVKGLRSMGLPLVYFTFFPILLCYMLVNQWVNII